MLKRCVASWLPRLDLQYQPFEPRPAPPGWDEPFQQPDFDEVTIVLRGRIRVEHDDGATDVAPGETVLVERGERIRYSNPFDEEAEYWAVCAPAFSPETANRDA